MTTRMDDDDDSFEFENMRNQIAPRSNRGILQRHQVRDIEFKNKVRFAILSNLLRGHDQRGPASRALVRHRESAPMPRRRSSSWARPKRQYTYRSFKRPMYRRPWTRTAVRRNYRPTYGYKRYTSRRAPFRPRFQSRSYRRYQRY